MGRIYTLSGENFTLGTGNVLAAIRTAADGLTAGGILRILRAWVVQNGTDTSDQLRAAIGTRDIAGTLTMTSATPRPHVLGGPASGISGSTAPAGTAARCGVNSSADSGGAYVDTITDNPNNLNGQLWVWTPEERPIVPPATVLVLRLLATPTGTTGFSCGITFEELV